MHRHIRSSNATFAWHFELEEPRNSTGSKASHQRTRKSRADDDNMKDQKVKNKKKERKKNNNYLDRTKPGLKFTKDA